MSDIHLNSAVDADLKELEGLSIRRVFTDGDNSGISDAGLKSIAKILGLESLDLEWAVNITDVGLNELHCLSTLKYIDLSYCSNITKGGVSNLKASIQGIEIEQ